jgi:hypothetical protein
MSMTSPGTNPITSKWGSRTLLFIACLLLGALYYVSFYGSETVRVDRKGVAFADSSHYFQLLENHHHLKCLEQEKPHNVEHRRKTIHHFDYLLIGDVVVSAAKLAGASETQAIWLLSPLFGALKFLLAFLLFRRAVGPALAWPGALAFALLPASWIYAAIPETWPMTSVMFLTILVLRELPISRWWLALLVAVFALNNFLLLLLVALLGDDTKTWRSHIAQLVRLGAFAVFAWLAMLTVLGLTLSPDFLPYNFIDHTVRFKARMAENLSVIHPARWAYNGVNGWIAPFVLNQPDLNFGRMAVVDSARAFPLGTMAVVTFVVLAGIVLRHQYRTVMAGVRETGSWFAQMSGIGLYLIAIFLASGLSLYYESFLYSGLYVPILLLFTVRALAGMRYGVVIMWVAAVIFALNAAQQIATYRGQLGV